VSRVVGGGFRSFTSSPTEKGFASGQSTLLFESSERRKFGSHLSYDRLTFKKSSEKGTKVKRGAGKKLF